MSSLSEWDLRSSTTTRLISLVAALVLTSVAAPSLAEVFLSKQEALEMAFPGADAIDRESVALSDEQAAQVEKASQAALESRLVTLYKGVKDGEVLGYALIDVHMVRTLPEAFMVVLSKEGEVRSVRILAFYEPPEYRPSDRWLKQFEGRRVEPGTESQASVLRLGKGIHGIAGSTLSARAVTGGVRRSMALYQLLVEPGSDVATSPAPSPSGGPAAGSR